MRDAAYCSASGTLADGGLCAHLRSVSAYTITRKEMIDFMDAQPFERKCVRKQDLPVCAEDQSTGVPDVLPPRGAAIAMSSEQWDEFKTELEKLCRMAGKYCKYEEFPAAFSLESK